jgi:hypothetical protein
MKMKTMKLKITKQVMSARFMLAGLFTLALMALATSCSTTNTKQSAANKTGEVCPECRTVTLGPVHSSTDWRGGSPTIAQRHECSGCRGVLTVYAEPLQFRHECSVCKQTPYSCQVAP